jgi:hypothetical protein
MDIKYFLGGVIGVCIGAAIITLASFEQQEREEAKWKQIMVDCGCGAYDTQTGEWYKIEMAPAPEPAPILGPDYMGPK